MTTTTIWMRLIGDKFGKPKAALRTPKSGEYWEIPQTSDDPFEKKPRAVARIREVREGWVRYAIGSTFPDERMRLNEFTAIYRLYTPTEAPGA